MKFWRWLRKVFCHHDFDCVAGFELYAPKKPWFKCKKCGHEEGL